MLAIKTEGLSKSYWINEHQEQGTGRSLKWALKDIDLEIEAGDSVAVLGKNGSGKSTLLKILSRIVHPTHGRFLLQGRLAALLEVGVGFHPDLTGRENIFLKGTLLGMHYRDIKKQLDTIIDFAEIQEYIDTPVKRYSSGMYLRLGFAVAAHIRSDIFIIDEALSVGDIAFQQKCFRKINTLCREEGRTIVLVSHSMESIQSLCNKALLLEKGKLVATGPALELAAQYYEKSIETAAAKPGESKDRYGNGNVLVSSVVFRDKEGKPAQELYSGAPLSITFGIEKRTIVRNSDIVLACAFGLHFGQYLLIWLSSEDKVYPAGDHFTLKIDALDLRPGVYYFSYRLGIGNLDPENITDAVENGFSFIVRNRETERIPFPSCIGNGRFSND